MLRLEYARAGMIRTLQPTAKWGHDANLERPSALTLMYVLVPTKVFAIELINSPDTPKSQILISPAVLARIFDGLMSGVSRQ